MKRVFADTNVFLRFLTRDDEGHSDQAAALFRAATAGEIEVVTGPPVLFELTWTLRRAYKTPRARCLEILSNLTAWPGLILLDRDLVEKAILRARESDQEFADAYIASSAASVNVDAIATFNRVHFDRLGVTLHPWDSDR